jgi:uncharacterized protein (DUF1800 family)
MTAKLKIESAIAANRFGLGARPGDLETIDKDPRSWLQEQLQGPSQTPAILRTLPRSDRMLTEVQELRKQQREARKNNEEADPSYGRTVRGYYMDQAAARWRNSVTTDHPFHERLVHFWSNHFAVSTDKQPLPVLAGAMENEAIRPNINGKFHDLLLAAEKHPAMLLYLDNQRSIGPNSEAGRRANRRNPSRNTGLNENLAREIMELHTLGVNGGYSQADVTAFARALTGWSIGGGSGRRQAGKPGRFHFRAEIHEPGTVHIMGKAYAEKGMAQGKAILADLATHEATARHIASKLARHFVADDPPPALVDELARVFLESGGELPAVHAALVRSAEPWRATHGKLKTPEEFVISTLRAFRHEPTDTRRIFAALESMGQTPYQPGSPAGWPDTAAHWGGADGLFKRIEWSDAVGQYAGKRVNPLELAEGVLGAALSDHTRTAIARAESLQQGLTLLLVSPDFQRR